MKHSREEILSFQLPYDLPIKYSPPWSIIAGDKVLCRHADALHTKVEEVYEVVSEPEFQENAGQGYWFIKIKVRPRSYYDYIVIAVWLNRFEPFMSRISYGIPYQEDMLHRRSTCDSTSIL